MLDLVSVIIPTHNRVNTLKKAVHSILAQTYQHFEIIIIDDASTDETQQIIQKLSDVDDRIHLVTNAKLLGGAQSRNKGIAISQGTWIAFLDDDDIWLPDKLTAQLSVLKRFPKAVAASCGYRVLYPLYCKKDISPPTHISFLDLLSANVLGGSSVCIGLARIIKDVGGFDNSLQSAQDWDLWIKLRMHGEIITVPKPLVNYYVRFNYRISNNMQAKYQGHRHFYFKYVKLMNGRLKEKHLSFLCFIRSRQSHRTIKMRLKYLLFAVRYNTMSNALLYILSSFPRVVLHAFSRCLK